jgi:phospholipase A1/A2
MRAMKYLPPSDLLALHAGLNRSLALGAIAMVCVVPLAAQTPQPTDLPGCAALADDATRLACYDRLAGRAAATAPPVPAGRTPDQMAPVTPAATEGASPGGTGLQPQAAPSFLSRYWELDDADKRGTFNFTGYRPNFLLPLHYTSRLNTQPTSPTPGRSGQLGDYQRVETKLQISLRTKIAQSVLLPGADLWFGYTQQSLWQLYNRDQSAPFRNTDYEPEVMYVVPTPAALTNLPWGWRWRFGMLALAHQSNGQAEPLSRSWNRVYLATGFERGDVSLVLRANRRLREDAASDDNPDLTTFRGRGDVQLNWTPGRATASLLWRTNYRDFKRGALQFDWTYPVEPGSSRALRYYVQVFSGYGETLLDYNFQQTSVGLGLTLFEF